MAVLYFNAHIYFSINDNTNKWKLESTFNSSVAHKSYDSLFVQYEVLYVATSH